MCVYVCERKARNLFIIFLCYITCGCERSFFLYIECVELYALKIILTLVKLEWPWYGMVLFTAEVPEVPLLCWPKQPAFEHRRVEKLREKLWHEWDQEVGS